MQKTDYLHHFIFEKTAVRGNVVKLTSSFQEAIQHQTLPATIKQALGELMAASALLIATLKMEGALVLQLQTNGILKLLVVECQSDLSIRATAKWDGEIADQSLAELATDGQFVITLDPKASEPYQGIVPMKGGNIAEMLEHYMLTSQQIDTSLWLHCNGENAAGMLLQKLPEVSGSTSLDEDAWNRINQLANTTSNEELSDLTAEMLLTRLFHEEDVRLFGARTLVAACSCSRDRVSNMLKTLGEPEVDQVIQEQGTIQINCDFCNKQYVFDEQDALELFAEQSPHNTKH